MLLALETIMSDAAISHNLLSQIFNIRKYGDWYCARQLSRLPHIVSRPQRLAGTHEAQYTQVLLATIKLTSYRQQTVAVTKDQAYSASYMHASIIVTGGDH